MIEVQVVVSNAEQKYTQKFLLHEDGLVVSMENELMRSMVDEARKNFKGIDDDVFVKIKFTP